MLLLNHSPPTKNIYISPRCILKLKPTCIWFTEFSDQEEEEDGEGEEEENDEGDEDEDEEDNGKRYEFRQRKAVVRYQAPLDGWFYSTLNRPCIEM